MELIIEPGRAETNYWRDLWRFRELFCFLAWRDLLVRYKQTVIGVAWVLVRPLLATIVFTVVFSRVAGLPSPPGVPYPLLVMAAMLPWQFFSISLAEAGNSLVTNSILISKIYFPRLIVPASAILTSLVDFLVTLVLMAAMMAWYGFGPDWRLVGLPLFTILALLASSGLGLWLCALNVQYRDFRYIVPFIVQFGLYISPVGFTSDHVPAQWHWLYWLNPVVGVIDGFRWTLLQGRVAFPLAALSLSAIVSTALCLSGIWYFRKVERTFADVI
jgi:lipopolysaccharide transport system permease protein